MAHTCRESCGVCGFLSPNNLEVMFFWILVNVQLSFTLFQLQEVEGDSYTEFTGANFDCGRNKRLCEVQGNSCDTKPEVDRNEVLLVNNENEATTEAEITASPENEASAEEEENNNDPAFNIEIIDLRQGGEPTAVFTSADVELENAYCGATIITDRWAVSAAHCYDKYGYNDEDEKRRTLRIRVGTPFEESVEVRNVYRHPDYRTRRLYNDVAVLELGRRIEYDFERSCQILSTEHFILTNTSSEG